MEFRNKIGFSDSFVGLFEFVSPDISATKFVI